MMGDVGTQRDNRDNAAETGATGTADEPVTTDESVTTEESGTAGEPATADEAGPTDAPGTTEEPGTADQSGVADQSDQPVKKGKDGKKGLKSVRDMVLSMAIITVGALILYSTLPTEQDKEPVREISYETEFATAGRAAPYELLAPRGLSDKWRATSVSYQAQSDHGAVWHLGFLDPADEYAAVEQGDGDERKFLSKVTQGASDTGKTVSVNGEDWLRYEGEKYDALVLKSDTARSGTKASGEKDTSADSGANDGEVKDGPVTTAVTGTASFATLKELAAALQPPSVESQG